MMEKAIIDEFEKYCDSLGDDCPVICSYALAMLKEQNDEMRVMFNRCIAYCGFDSCVFCRFAEDCESMRTMHNGYVLEHKKRVRRGSGDGNDS